jgi:hypothetical protein
MISVRYKGMSSMQHDFDSTCARVKFDFQLIELPATYIVLIANRCWLMPLSAVRCASHFNRRRTPHAYPSGLVN